MAKRVSIVQAAANALRAWLDVAMVDSDADTVLPDAIKLSVATAVTPVTFTVDDFDGSLGGAISENGTDQKYPRNVTVTTTVRTATYDIVDPIVVTGTNQDGTTITENLALTQVDGGETVTGSIFFSSITTIEVPAQTTALGAFTFGVANVHNVTLYDRWPEATVPLRRAVSVLLVGKPIDELTDPVLLDSTPVVGSDVLRDFLYRMGTVRQNIQINVWAVYDVDRDDIIQRLDDALNASDQLTIGDARAALMRVGLTLELGDGWTGRAEYLFDGADRDQTADKSQQAEMTAIYSGYVDVMPTNVFRKRRAPKITEIIVHQQNFLGTNPTVDIATITDDDATTTFTEEPA